MQTHRYSVLAASGATPLVLVVIGIVLVVALVAMVVVGRRRAARSTTPSTPPPGVSVEDQAQRGTGWQTPDDDPEQGHPRRPGH